MIFSPSPQALLHGHHPHYDKPKTHITLLSENPKSAKEKNDNYLSFCSMLIDQTFLNSSTSKNPNLISRLNAIIEMSYSCDYDRKIGKSILNFYFAIISLQCNDVENAIHFIKYAVENNNIFAINLLAKIYFSNLKSNSKFSLENTKRYLTSSRRLRSIDSLFQLGVLFQKTGNFFYSLYFFYSHFCSVSSSISIVKICQLVKEYINNDQLFRKCILFSISKGEPEFLNDAIYGACGHDRKKFPEMSKIWKSTNLNFNKSIGKTEEPKIYFSPKDEDEISSEIKNDVFLKSPFDFNTNPNTNSIVKPIIHLIHEFKKTDINYEVSIQRKLIEKENDKSPFLNYYPFYPLKNKTKIIFEIFELTTSNFERRNLKMAKFLIHQLNDKYSVDITKSEIFECRKKSKNQEWLINCGFIYLLVDNNELGYKMFSKASSLGSFCATSLCGFLLFHLKNDDNQLKKKAAHMFLKCVDDPVSLIHLSFIFDDRSLIDRACSILGIKSRSKCILWLVKLLIEGIKYPFLSDNPPKMFCLAAIEFGMEDNDDTLEIFDFINEYKNFPEL